MKQIPITVNIYSGAIMQPSDATKIATKDTDKPQLYYGDHVIFCVSFVDNDGETVALGSADTFELALDTDFIHTNSLMVWSSSSNGDVDVSGDWTSIDRATGKISIRVNCETTGFQEKLSATQNIAPWLEIKRFVDGDQANVCQHQIVGRNNVHLDEGEPVDASPDYRTAAAQDSIDAAQDLAIAAKVSLSDLLKAFTFDATSGRVNGIKITDTATGTHNRTITINADGEFVVPVAED